MTQWILEPARAAARIFAATYAAKTL